MKKIKMMTLSLAVGTAFTFTAPAFGGTAYAAPVLDLVHRHGSSCSSREIAAALFEDEPYDKKQQSYLQTLIAVMMKSLKAVGAEAAVNKDYNSMSVNTKVLDCDYYRFAELDAGAVNAYSNEYMSQYYWAEFMTDDWE